MRELKYRLASVETAGVILLWTFVPGVLPLAVKQQSTIRAKCVKLQGYEDAALGDSQTPMDWGRLYRAPVQGVAPRGSWNRLEKEKIDQKLFFTLIFLFAFLISAWSWCAGLLWCFI